MANETTSTEVAEFAQKVLADAVYVAQANSLFMPGNPGEQFLRMRDLTATKAKSADFPKWNELTADTQAENADVETWQQMDADAVTVTATIKTVPVFVSRMAVDTADEDLARDRGIQMGNAFAKKVDTDVCALFSGFTNSVGTSGENLTMGEILQGIDMLENAEVPRPYLVTLSPRGWYQLLIESNSKFMEVAKFGPVAEEVIRTYRTFQALGCLWAISPRVPTANAEVDLVGSIMGTGALGMVWKWMPRIDTQEDISRGGGGFEFIGKYANGVAEIEDTYGVKIIHSASAGS